jgi:hypothetical protein
MNAQASGAQPSKTDAIYDAIHEGIHEANEAFSPIETSISKELGVLLAIPQAAQQARGGDVGSFEATLKDAGFPKIDLFDNGKACLDIRN